MNPSQDSLLASLQPSSQDTPMMQQYKSIKKECLDAILFFRLGDFYEMFLTDATVAARELDLTLTGRGKDENRIPMCGIPYHAAENYIPKLIQKGYKVAICEQTEDPAQGKGITKREIVKIITPGTIIGHGTIDEQDNNYIAAITPQGNEFAISFADASTGEFKLLTLSNELDLHALLEQLQIKECLLPENTGLTLGDHILSTTLPFLTPDRAQKKLQDHFSLHSLDCFGITHLINSYPAAWAIIDYLKTTQKHQLPHLTKLLPHTLSQTLFMDKTTIRNLELTAPIHKEDKTGTLFWVLNHTKTAMGARKLKTTLKTPYTDPTTITTRLDAVKTLKEDLLSREEIRETLKDVYDLERLISRIASDLNHPKDCLALKDSLLALKNIYPILNQLENPLLTSLKACFKALHQTDSEIHHIITLIDQSIQETAPNTLKDGGVIKPGYSQALDDLIASFKDIKSWIAALEEQERTSTGIKSIKVRYNKVFGYYIEVPKTHSDTVPEHYIRKQTLTNAERYITPELKEKETLLLSGEDKQQALEEELYKEIITTIKHHIPALQDCAANVADLDTIQSLAHVAQTQNYTQPTIINDPSATLNITKGRHPVLEKNKDVHFIPNDITMNRQDNQFILITGPNMAGKSTIMRQIALIVIMAQIGSFVPADQVELSIVDKLFTRIGALDNLYSGQSTFMVEMLETATIINNATANSLIILDEIGRGTSTYDGMSIAGAVTEHIHTKIGARTLFATHYHELTSLADTYPNLSNYSMKITEENGSIVFNYQFIKGPADKSYGIHVAQMAGLPEALISRANTLLNGFESHGLHYLKNSPITQDSPQKTQDYTITVTTETPAQKTEEKTEKTSPPTQQQPKEKNQMSLF